jgi:acetyl-CoA carboxylase carboxyltransferase component
MNAMEWAALIGAFAAVLGPTTAVLIAVIKLRAENRRQHEHNKEAAETRFSEIRQDVSDLGIHVDRRLDRLDDKITDRMDRHESLFHRGRRRW